MATPYVGEIRIFAGNFPPNGWMFCEGQLLPISENETLFQLIGTIYGGDGQETFALPDLRGRVPVHMGNGFIIGEKAGVESVTLTAQQIPIHSHVQLCHSGGGANTANPANAVSSPSDISQYSTAGSDGSQMGNPAMLSDIVGGSQPHTNFMPYLCLNFIISLFGIFPAPN
ncbi:MAG TPA: tail fiber protein [Pyrinomonadaceae bacterium]|nr:tail fiber protein [Pyrinomonadaceae bacterium]